MKRILFLVCFSSCLLFTGCNRDDDPVDPDSHINKWIYGQMDLWYLWTSSLPESPDYSPDPEFFYKSLLYKKEDRFSFIYPDYDKLLKLLMGVSMESGFEYRLYQKEENPAEVVMSVVYIKPDSPASDLGLKRGDVISSINGVSFTTSNYRGLLAQMNEPYELTYSRYNFETEAFEAQSPLTLTPIVYSENPVYLDTVFTFNSKKIGYLIYNFFANGPTSNDNRYNLQVEEAFARFKSEGIADLVLDLRYNTGGNEYAAVNLASLIVNASGSNSLMFRKKYNRAIEESILNDPDLGEDFLNIRFEPKSANVGGMLEGGRVYMLTSARTASASEVIINSLRPYMDVYLIGDTTVGKDVGSVTLYDEKDPSNTWGLQPIVVKIENSSGEDYPDGFAPDILLKDHSLILYPFGSPEEPLLGMALSQITGSARMEIPEPTAPPIHQSMEYRGFLVDSSNF